MIVGNSSELDHYDILPLGANEALPVSLERDGLPRSYPEALCLMKGVDAERLVLEFNESRRIIPESLISGREHLLVGVENSERLFKSLKELGFYKGVYAAIAMRGPNQTDLLDEIGVYTKKVLAELGARSFRQQYVIAEPGWSSTVHFDHYNFKVHGLRLHIPLTTSSFMAYPQENGSENIYELSPGEIWFINSGRDHYAYNSSKKIRINIQVQIDSDWPVLQALRNINA